MRGFYLQLLHADIFLITTVFPIVAITIYWNSIAINNILNQYIFPLRHICGQKPTIWSCINLSDVVSETPEKKSGKLNWNLSIALNWNIIYIVQAIVFRVILEHITFSATSWLSYNEEYYTFLHLCTMSRD